jgi:hypothetical protein
VKKSITGIVLMVLGAIVVLNIIIFILTLVFEDGLPPKLPTKSMENYLVITSNGCCFWVENVNITLHDNNNNILKISQIEKLYGHDIFKYKIPNILFSPIKILVEFRAYYADECDFSMVVLEFENILALKEKGVLLYFQEHDDVYLNVLSGNYHTSYKMGHVDNRWAMKDIPNKIYP